MKVSISNKTKSIFRNFKIILVFLVFMVIFLYPSSDTVNQKSVEVKVESRREKKSVDKNYFLNDLTASRLNRLFNILLSKEYV